MAHDELGFCSRCNADVPAAPNPHRTRNTAATHFASANLALAPRVVSSFGPTSRYVCPFCGEAVTVVNRARPQPPR